MDHDHAHGCAQIRVASEFVGGRKSDQHRKERERRCRAHVDKGGNACHGRKEVDDRFARHEQSLGCQDVVEAHEQTAGNDGRDDRDKDVREYFHGPHERIAFFGILLLNRTAAGTGKSGLFKHFVCDKIHGA